MNVLFALVFLVSSAAVLLFSPESFLPALLSGAESALKLGVTLAAVYTVWLGFLKIAEDAKLTRALAKGLKPVTSRLFRVKDEETLGHIAVNMSANLLGMGGAATPAGISAMRRMEKSENKNYAQAMLFVVNCAGLQLLPVTVVSLREKFGSSSSYDVILPVMLSSLLALVLGAALVRVFCGAKKKR